MPTCKGVVASTLLVLCIAVIAGCGSSSSGSSSGGSGGGSSSTSSSSPGANAKPDPAVVKLLPASLKSKSTFVEAQDASYAPDEFVASDGRTIIGLDTDLTRALAALMGKKLTTINVPFGSILAGLTAGKYDFSASSFTDTKEREKSVDFVTYGKVGESFYTKASGGTSINSIADICGKTVSVEQGTTEKDDANAQSAKCKKEGKPGVTVRPFQDQNGANLAVSSGRAQLGFADTQVAGYQVKKTNGLFKLVGQPYAVSPYGIAVPKKPGLAPAMLAALKVLMKNGTYHQIFVKWGATTIETTNSRINGAIS